MRESTRNGSLSVTCLLFLLSVMSGCGDWVPPPIAPKFASILAPDAQGKHMLVVFTYGYGCSATGRGNGLRDMAEAVHNQFPTARVITRAWNDDDGIDKTVYSHNGPVILIGHSFGGCISFEIATRSKRQIDSLILLDPVPTSGEFFRHEGKYFETPSNVHYATCFYRPPGFFPISYPLMHPHSVADNRLRDLGHSEFCENAEVRQCILQNCALQQIRLEGFTAAQPLHDVVQASR